MALETKLYTLKGLIGFFRLFNINNLHCSRVEKNNANHFININCTFFIDCCEIYWCACSFSAITGLITRKSEGGWWHFEYDVWKYAINVYLGYSKNAILRTFLRVSNVYGADTNMLFTNLVFEPLLLFFRAFEKL